MSSPNQYVDDTAAEQAYTEARELKKKRSAIIDKAARDLFEAFVAKLLLTAKVVQVYVEIQDREDGDLATLYVDGEEDREGYEEASRFFDFHFSGMLTIKRVFKWYATEKAGQSTEFMATFTADGVSVLTDRAAEDARQDLYK